MSMSLMTTAHYNLEAEKLALSIQQNNEEAKRKNSLALADFNTAVGRKEN